MPDRAPLPRGSSARSCGNAYIVHVMLWKDRCQKVRQQLACSASGIMVSLPRPVTAEHKGGTQTSAAVDLSY